MSKNQFTGTATQPHRNRKLCQFNNDQYCRGHKEQALFRRQADYAVPDQCLCFFVTHEHLEKTMFVAIAQFKFNI